MFNDDAWINEATRTQSRSFDAWLAIVRGRRLLILEIGAGTATPTIRHISERTAERPQTTLVRLNPDAREVDDGCVLLRLPARQALERIAEVLPDSTNRPATSAALPDAGLKQVAAREMEVLEFRPPSRRERARPRTPAEVPSITYVDLQTGAVGVVPPDFVHDNEIAQLLAPWFESGPGPYVPLPTYRGVEVAGYRMCGGLVTSPGAAVDATHGAALLRIQGPKQEDVVRIGFARRPYEGAWLWRHLHQTAQTPVMPLEYPREPWIVTLPDRGAARNVAMRGPLAQIACAVAIAWLRHPSLKDLE